MIDQILRSNNLLVSLQSSSHPFPQDLFPPLSNACPRNFKPRQSDNLADKSDEEIDQQSISIVIDAHVKDLMPDVRRRTKNHSQIFSEQNQL
jgi:hypothetical protein